LITREGLLGSRAYSRARGLSYFPVRRKFSGINSADANEGKGQQSAYGGERSDLFLPRQSHTFFSVSVTRDQQYSADHEHHYGDNNAPRTPEKVICDNWKSQAHKKQSVVKFRLFVHNAEMVLAC
jgi:hypothetical protein